MFIPPINLGQFQPSPATIAEWVYQIWQYLQENPIATQEQLQEYIATFITTSPETQELIGEGVEQYLEDNPPEAPVQSVQGKTGAVTLAFNDILKNNNTAPVYRAASMPSQSTLQAQYNLGYRLFVNTSTQEIYSITNTGGTTLVGKGKFDGTVIDLDTAQGDTTIAEAVSDLEAKDTEQDGKIDELYLDDGDYDFTCDAFGFLTSNKTLITVTIPLDKIIPDGKTLKMTRVNLTLRTVTGSYIPSSGYDVPSSEFDSITYRRSGLRLTFLKSGGWTSESINNTPLAGGLNVKFTIS